MWRNEQQNSECHFSKDLNCYILYIIILNIFFLKGGGGESDTFWNQN